MMKKLRFTKMHGISNDYVYISTFDQPEEDWEQLAIRLSDRRTGIGGDGIILVCPSDVADAKMRIFNADGSEGMMCGNGIRCVGKFVYDKGLVPADKTTVTIDTLSGIKTLELTVRDGKVQSARVDMGAAILTPAEIPVVFDKEKMIDEGLTVDGREWRVTAVSMGNPHCVTFVDDVDGLALEKIGPHFEHHPAFPLHRGEHPFVGRRGGKRSVFDGIVIPALGVVRSWQRFFCDQSQNANPETVDIHHDVASEVISMF